MDIGVVGNNVVSVAPTGPKGFDADGNCDVSVAPTGPTDFDVDGNAPLFSIMRFNAR
jgi:hypothetical protein